MFTLLISLIFIFANYPLCFILACPDNTFQGATPDDCYAVLTYPDDFGNQEINCNRIGGHITSVSNAFELSIIYKIAQQQNFTSDFWIGAFTVGASNMTVSGNFGNFFWLDGTNFTYSNWAPGQPCANINCPGPQNMSQIAVGILVQLQTSQWYPQIDNYGISYPAICKVPSTPTSCGFINNDHMFYGYYQLTQKCYYLLNAQFVFINSPFVFTANTCTKAAFDQNTNATDVPNISALSIHSFEESTIIANLLAYNNVIVTKALIGLQYNSVKNSWEWMDGTPFDYANWLTGYPSNKSISTSVVEINMQLNYNNGYNKWANDQNNPYDGDYFFCQSPGMAPSQKR